MTGARVMQIIVRLPLHLVSEANARDSRFVKARRVAEQRWLVRQFVRTRLYDACSKGARLEDDLADLEEDVAAGRLSSGWQIDRWSVLMTRIAPRALDSDNLVSSMKAVRDGIADALGHDDRDARIAWECAQRRPTPSDNAVVHGHGVELLIQGLS